MSYLKFEDAGFSNSGKTSRWRVTSLNNSKLGIIAWYGPWRKYVFDPFVTSSIVLDAQCLREIAEFLDSENKQHKETLKLAKQMSETKNEKTNSTSNPNPNELQVSD